MMIEYETYVTQSGEEYVKAVLPDGREMSIPNDPANSDYQRYLRWLENPDAEEDGTLS